MQTTKNTVLRFLLEALHFPGTNKGTTAAHRLRNAADVMSASLRPQMCKIQT